MAELLPNHQFNTFHGTRVTAEIIYYPRASRNFINKLFDIEEPITSQLVLLQEIEIEENYEVKVESLIGYNGKPAIIIPNSKRFKGVLKKLVSQHSRNDNFDDIIRGFAGNRSGGGYGDINKYVSTFDLNVYFSYFEGELLKTVSYTLKGCIPVSIKRNVTYNSFVTDEVMFEFEKVILNGNLN